MKLLKEEFPKLMLICAEYNLKIWRVSDLKIAQAILNKQGHV